MYWLLILSVTIACSTFTRDTTQTTIAPRIQKCYQIPFLMDKNNLPPMTIQVLIDIIRQIEDSPGVDSNLERLSALLLNTYRQDGIEYQTESSEYLPFAPTYHSFHRHRLVLNHLIPNLLTLREDILSPLLVCALHRMLSTTVDARIDDSNCNSGSSCALLDGVISTPWGAVSAGHVIAGIAAGAQLQRVLTVLLAKGTTLDYPNVQETVCSIYPATVSGDLAEAVLIQGRSSSSISIGVTGSWNSTQAHRHYIINSLTNNEMTDPEIRGDIDGYVLGANLHNIFLNTFGSLKLSTLLDMYYSARHGVFNEHFRSCNRQALGRQYIRSDNLADETYAFAAALDTHLSLPGTVTGLDTLVTDAVDNFQTYTAEMNDICVPTMELDDYRIKTNLYIALDASWEYAAVYPAISYLLDEIEVNKYGSSVTLLSAFDGSVIVDTKFSIADFHMTYNIDKHQSMMVGVNLQASLTNIKNMMHENLIDESMRNYIGGASTVLVYLINSNVDNNDAVLKEAISIRYTVPDLRIIFAFSTNQINNLNNLVQDMENDIKTISLTTAGTNVNTVMNPVLERIKLTGRRIINPRCGPNFTNDQASGTRQFEDLISPDSFNFYTVSPNYFYEDYDYRKIKIIRNRGGVGSLVVCYSRTVEQPRRSAIVTEADEEAITCMTLNDLGDVEVSLQNACAGYCSPMLCPPFYISVQLDTRTGTTTSSGICTDNSVCRFPFDLRYLVEIQDLGCFSDQGPTVDRVDGSIICTSGSSSLSKFWIPHLAFFTFMYLVKSAHGD